MVQGGGGDGVPQLLSRLSGMLNDPNLSGMLVDPNTSAPMEDQSFNQRLASFARLQQEYQDHQDQPVRRLCCYTHSRHPLCDDCHSWSPFSNKQE